jgi:DNA-binding MurR/RpiR family transcriptional regulator
MDVNKSLDHTFKMLNYQDIIISANIIYNAKNIVMCCIGNNKLPANDFQQKLTRINKNVKFDPDYHLQYVSACNLNDDDVAIGLSYSGLSSEVIMCLDAAKKNGAKTIFLTSNTERFFDYDFVFYLDKSESLYRKSSMTSRTSFQVILDLIFLELYQNDPDTFDSISEKNRLIK